MRKALSTLLTLVFVIIAFGFAQPVSAQITIEITDCGTLGGGHSHAWVMNNLGHIAGQSTIYDRVHGMFLWTPEDGMIELGTIDGYSGNVYGINDLDQIVGVVTVDPTGFGSTRAFIWEDGVISHLEDLGGTRSQATDINNLGQIAGRYRLAPGAYEIRGFFGDWRQGTGGMKKLLDIN